MLVRLEPGVPAGAVASEIARWKHLGAVTEGEEERYLT